MTENALLLERIKNGDTNAQNIMIEQNMRLVEKIAGKFKDRGYDREELVQVGVIGLIKAVRNFNTDFNTQFSTYAYPVIEGEIKRFIRDDGSIKVSRSLKENAAKGWRAEERLREKLNREPTIKEISVECGISEDDLMEAFEAAAAPKSIYETVYDNSENEIKLLDVIADNDSEENMINKVMVNDILDSLKPREKKIIILRYYRRKTQNEVAKIIGVSQVQVSRIEKSIMDKLRNRFK